MKAAATLPTLAAGTARPPGRWPRRLAALPWAAFLVWTAVGAVVMPLRLRADGVAAALAARGLPPWLGELTGTILRAGDAVWIVLAAVVVYLDTAAAEGLARTRRWAGLLLAGAAAAEWLGARTGFPFGPYAYTTDRFGWRLGGVLPFTIPLAWLVIVLGGRALVGRVWPTAGRAGLALGVAAVGVATDVNLEFIAWRERGYWVWYPGWPDPLPTWPPWQNFAAWFVLLGAFAFALSPDGALRSERARRAAGRPALVLLAMNGLFLLVHAARWLRSP